MFYNLVLFHRKCVKYHDAVQYTKKCYLLVGIQSVKKFTVTSHSKMRVRKMPTLHSGGEIKSDVDGGKDRMGDITHDTL